MFSHSPANSSIPYTNYTEANQAKLTPHWFCLILSLICLCLTIQSALSYDPDDILYIIYPATSYLIYLVECFCIAKTPRFLLNKFELHEFNSLLRRIKEARPTLKLGIDCYHLGDKKQQITTYTVTQNFVFYDYSDETGEIHGIERHDVVKLRIGKFYSIGDNKTYERIEKQKRDLISKNKHRDERIKLFIIYDIPFYKENVVVMTGNGRSPIFFCITGYIFCSLLLLSWPYRLWTESVAPTREFRIVKRIGSDPNKVEMVNFAGNINNA